MGGRAPGALDNRALRLLCLCLRSRWDPPALQAASDLASQDPGSWERVAALARRELLAALLYDTVRGKGLVPRQTEEEWRSIYHHSLLRGTRLFHQLAQVLQRLDEVDCPVLLLKGAALAETVYGNVALRPMADLDLLVPPSRINPAQGILVQLGYAPLTSDPWPGFSQRYRNSMAFQRTSGYLLPWMVGLHWHLFDVAYYERIRIDEWFGRSQPAFIGGAQALLPSPEDHLVYLCGHLAVHHQYDPALIRYYDMAALVHLSGGTLDWDTVLRRAVDWRLVTPVQRGLYRLEDLWPGTVPIEALRVVGTLRPSPTERAVHGWVADRPRTPTSDTLLSLVTLPGPTRRVGFLVEVAFPSPAYMRRRYCRRRPGLWPLAYALRLCTALRYLTRRHGRRGPTSPSTTGSKDDGR